MVTDTPSTSAPATAPAPPTTTPAAAGAAAGGTASGQAPDGAAAAAAVVQVSYPRKVLMKFLLRAIAISSYSASGANLPRPQEATGQQLYRCLRAMFERAGEFGGSLFALAASVVTDLVHHDPLCYRALDEEGLPAAFIAAVKVRLKRMLACRHASLLLVTTVTWGGLTCRWVYLLPFLVVPACLLDVGQSCQMPQLLLVLVLVKGPCQT